MSDIKIEMDINPKQAALDELAFGLNEHSRWFVDKPGFQPIAFFAYDAQGVLRGGIYGRLNWNWLSISLLWVNPEDRGSGLGSNLLKRLETEATDRGCTKSHVDTFSFQAKSFYLACGYELFAELPNYPDENSRLYFKKAL